MNPVALLDSNVVVAAVVDTHEHHSASLDVFSRSERGALAVSAQSYAEAYCVLTRRGGDAPFQFAAGEAWAALESVRAVTSLVGLTSGQAFEAVRDYSRAGGIGARLYDKLIGEAAVAHAIPIIVTWNERHMRSLFPQLRIVTPAALGALPDRS